MNVAVNAAAAFTDVVPSRVLGGQHPPEEIAHFEVPHTLKVPVNRFRADPVKLHPCPRARDSLVSRVVPLILRVDPDEFARCDFLFGQDLQLLRERLASPV
jgi:hypothetical protein